MANSVGPRPGRPNTRAEIIRAAKSLFARGYTSCSLRAVAREAHVDPSLIVQFFGNKEGLYLAAVSDGFPGEGMDRITDDPSPGVGKRIAAYYFGLWEEAETRGPLQALLMSAASHRPAADLFREFISRELISKVAAGAVPDRAELRAALAGSHLLGSAVARYVVGVGPLVELTLPELARFVGATVDAYLFGPLPLSPEPAGNLPGGSPPTAA